MGSNFEETQICYLNHPKSFSHQHWARENDKTNIVNFAA